MSPGARQLFIYYRIPQGDAAAAIAAVRRMQQQLRQEHPGLRTDLLQRPATATPELTLMETYAIDADVCPQGVDEALQARIEAVAPRIAAARHVEVFEACA